MNKKAEQEAFIIDWLRNGEPVCAVDQPFHDAFHARFGGKRRMYTFGACPVLKAQRLLANMASQGILSRGIIGLYNAEPGFPHWVYIYSKVTSG